MKIEIEVESVKMLREALCLVSQAADRYALDTGQMQYRHAGYKVEDFIMELDKHRPVGSDGTHDEKHTATCGCEDKFVGLGIRNYLTTFTSASTSRKVVIAVEAVQWDGTKEHAEQLQKWVIKESPYQGLEYFGDRDESLRVNGPFLILGMGNDFGDFDILQPSDYLYVSQGHFRMNSAERFEKQFKEVE